MFLFPVQLVGLLSSGIVFIVILWLAALFEPLPKVSHQYAYTVASQCTCTLPVYELITFIPYRQH